MIASEEKVVGMKGLQLDDWFAAGMSLALLAVAALLLAFGWA